MEKNRLKFKAILSVFIAILSISLFAIYFHSCGPGNPSEEGGLGGTCAIGRPLAGVPVFLKDSKGKERSAITNDKGKFFIKTAKLTPPFSLRAQGYELFSYLNQQTGTANLTPLSNAVIAIGNKGNLDIYTDPPSDPLDLSNANNSLSGFINEVLKEYNVSEPDTVDFINTPFDANGTKIDAVIDAISITGEGNTIETKNSFTQETIGTGTLEGSTINPIDPITEAEAKALPKSTTYKKYFTYAVAPDGIFGPLPVDILISEGNTIAVTLTGIGGESGDLWPIFGSGTISGNTIQFHFENFIMCSDTVEPTGTPYADFTGIISGNTITGNFENRLPGGECVETGDSVYSGTWTAEEVLNAATNNIAGNWDVYVQWDTWPEEGPHPFTINQTGSAITITFTVEGQQRQGSGLVYGKYAMFQLPVIPCADECPPSGCKPAQYAPFLGELNPTGDTMSGMLGAGLPPDHHCKAYDYDTTGETIKPIGTWRATKK